MAKKETVILDFEVDSNDAVTSIEKLTAANKALREERKKVDLSTEEGLKRVKEINAQLDKNTNTIKDNSSALEKQRFEVGNYTGALDKLVPGMGSTIEGFKGMVRSATAFIATPIGAVIGALGVVLGIVVAAIKRSEVAMDLLEDASNAVAASIDFFFNNLKAIGQFLGNVFSGNLVQARAGLSELSKEFIEVQKQTKLYTDLSRDLEDATAKLNIQTAGAENQIKSLITQSKNRNLSFLEQQKLLKEASKLEKDLVDRRTELATKEEIITIKQIALKRGIKQTEEENLQAFIDRLIASEELSGEEKDQIADVVAAREEAASAGIDIIEKIQNQEDAAFEKEKERLNKVNEERKKALEKREAEAKKQQELNDQIAKSEEDKAARQKAANDKELSDTISRLDKKRNAEEALLNFEISAADEAAISETEAANKSYEEYKKFEEKKREESEKTALKWAENLEKISDKTATITNGLSAISDQYFANQEAKLETNLAEQNKILNEAYNRELDILKGKFERGELSQEEYDKAVLGLNERLQADKKAAEIKQAQEINKIKEKEFNANKAAALIQVAVDTSIAVAKAFAASPLTFGLPWSAAAGVMGGVQAGLILAQKFVPTTFRTGGYTGDGNPNELAGLTHKQEFVMPADVVSKFGRDHFESYMDGSAIANAATSGMNPSSQMQPIKVYTSWTEFKKFENEMNIKAEIVEA